MAAGSAHEAIALLTAHTEKPALLISGLRLRAAGESGIEAIEMLHTEYDETIPAMLITGDTAADCVSDARERVACSSQASAQQQAESANESAALPSRPLHKRVDFRLISSSNKKRI